VFSTGPRVTTSSGPECEAGHAGYREIPVAGSSIVVAFCVAALLLILSSFDRTRHRVRVIYP